MHRPDSDRLHHQIGEAFQPGHALTIERLVRKQQHTSGRVGVRSLARFVRRAQGVEANASATTRICVQLPGHLLSLRLGDACSMACAGCQCVLASLYIYTYQCTKIYPDMSIYP